MAPGRPHGKPYGPLDPMSPEMGPIELHMGPHMSPMVPYGHNGRHIGPMGPFRPHGTSYETHGAPYVDPQGSLEISVNVRQKRSILHTCYIFYYI